MWYSLRVCLLLFGIVSLLGIGLIVIPVTFVIHYSEFRTLGQVAVSGAWVIGIVCLLLWIVGQVWQEIVRLRTERMEQECREASFVQIPSWGTPPPMPHSSAPAPNPPSREP